MPKKPTPKTDLKATLTRKVGPLPLWAWGAVGIGAYYVYTRATGAGAPTTVAGSEAYESTPAYDTGTYPSGGGGASGGYDTGAGAPSSIPLEYTGKPIPVKVTIKRPKRRHNRQPGTTGPRHHPPGGRRPLSEVRQGGYVLGGGKRRRRR